MSGLVHTGIARTHAHEAMHVVEFPDIYIDKIRFENTTRRTNVFLFAHAFHLSAQTLHFLSIIVPSMM